MNESIKGPEAEQKVETLNEEVAKFADSLSYWAKFLAEKILLGNAISDIDVNNAYLYLLEELALTPKTNKPDITINCNGRISGNYKIDLLFNRLENVEGVNALMENQVIDFCPNLTIIYGSNGSGKSGYVRLLKKVFYSKSPEDIIQNIHVAIGHKTVSANFIFNSAGSDVPLNYPKDIADAAFKQYAVFDNGSVRHHFDHKNEFEFRPSGLSFFAELTEAIKRVELKLNSEIDNKQMPNDFVVWFDGESEIKTFVQGLSARTTIAELNKYAPFTEKDKTDKAANEKKHDEFALTHRNKEREILKLESIRKYVVNNKAAIEAINTYFTAAYLANVQTAITSCVEKEAIAKAEGIENFKTDKILSIGTDEWKNFLVASEKFAKQQKDDTAVYPESGDNCLLCYQPLSENAKNLIQNYWVFIKSLAEQNAALSQQTLSEMIAVYDKVSFDLFPVDNILTTWLTENYPQVLTSLEESLAAQKALTANILAGIKTKTTTNWTELLTSVAEHNIIISTIDESIKFIREGKQSVELSKLQQAKTYLFHKEKYNTHFTKFTAYIQNQQWISNASKINWLAQKRNITEREKALSGKYFNQKYIDTFNQECLDLDGNFGIEVNHTGSAGTSFRQLTLKGRNPAAILSEGEQKVIALADFITETHLSEVNRGIIFDDPVNSLDEVRKKNIACRLISESVSKQVIVFTHDLIFVSNLITSSEEYQIPFLCHWIENQGGKPGQVWLKNAPSYEKEYRNAEPAKRLYTDANKDDCPPAQREYLVRAGFTALRTCYEVLVINGLFKDVVQRYNERVSMESLKDVYFDETLIAELSDSFAQCCRYMEGHTHSDKYAYMKPGPVNLNDEIQRYEAIRTKIKKAKRP